MSEPFKAFPPSHAFLGETQKNVLRALREHDGTWYPGCGWIWGNKSQTERVLMSLVRRGFVSYTDRTTKHPYMPPHVVRVYRIVT